MLCLCQLALTCCLRVPAIVQVNRANETIQCESCDRILEERYNDFRVAPVNIERDSPYCVVTNDTLAQHKSLHLSLTCVGAGLR